MTNRRRDERAGITRVCADSARAYFAGGALARDAAVTAVLEAGADGATVYETAGYWRDDSGAVVDEPAYALEVIGAGAENLAQRAARAVLEAAPDETAVLVRAQCARGIATAYVMGRPA